MSQDLVPVELTLARLLASVDPLGPERIDVSDALGRVLADELRASSPLPARDNAAMDGYAIRAADTAGASVGHPVRFDVVGSAFAGAAGTPDPIGPGEAVTIATGAHVPDGADAVVRLERTLRHGAVITVHEEVRRGDDVRRQGEDLRAGDLVLEAGTVLGVGQLAAASGTGHAQVRVTRRPDVAIVLTGDEVHRAGTPSDSTRAGLDDAIGPALVGLARDAGAASVELHGPVPDDRERLTAVVEKLSPHVDVLVTVGGVSKGERDHLPAVVSALGELSHGGVALRPGKPFRYGRVADTTVLCLPGNPGAALVAATVFLRPVVSVMGGSDATAGAPLRARVSRPFRQRPGRQHWVGASVTEGSAGRSVHPVGRSGSAMLHALGAANAWMVVPADVEELATGDEVDVVPTWGDAGRAGWRS